MSARIFSADVLSVMDAVIRAGGGIGYRADDPAGPVRFSGARPDLPVPDAAIHVLTGLRGAICNGDGSWVWTPDPSDDVAVKTRPYSNVFHLYQRAS